MTETFQMSFSFARFKIFGKDPLSILLQPSLPEFFLPLPPIAILVCLLRRSRHFMSLRRRCRNVKSVTHALAFHC